jgi:diguanylate cyclase (GGDEF)-like protein/PAS domain S-box-containing protein
MRSPTKSIALLVLLYWLLSAAWILGSDYLLNQIFPDPATTAAWQTVKGLAFVLGSAIFFYLGLRSTVAATAMRCTLERARALDSQSPELSPQRLNVRAPITIFLVLSLVLAVVGGGIYVQVSRAIRTQQWSFLKDMAGLKTRQIAAWRQERSGDAAIIAGDRNLMVATQYWLQDPAPDRPVPERIARRLEALRQARQYGAVMICDAAGRKRYPPPEQAGEPVESAALREALLENTPVFSAFHSPVPGQPEIIDFVMPLTDVSGGSPVVFGALVLRVDGKSPLFPPLQWWTRESRSAETLLVQGLGDGRLSVIRFGANEDEALALKLGLEGDDSAVAFASRLRQPGLFDVRDYRGMPVLAAVSIVPDSNWLLIAKIDKGEIYLPLEQLAKISIAVMLFLLATAGVGVGLWWRQQVANVALEGLQGQLQRHILLTHYESLLKHANDIILLLDDQGVITEANDRALEAYGAPREELVGRNMRELRCPDSLVDFDLELQKAFDEGIIFESRHRRGDGSTFPVEVSARRIEAGGRAWCQSIIRDITERKQAEQKIQRLTRLYNVLSHTNQAVVRYHDRQELFPNVCRIAVERGFLRMAVITSIDLSARVIAPVAAFGAEPAFLETITFDSLCGAEDRGPILQVVKEKRPFLCNDVATDPRLRDHREEAVRFGWQSMAILPVHSFSEFTGTLNLYAAEKDFFDPDLVAVLEEVAADITFALNTFEKEAARKKAEERLLETTATLKAMYQATPLPVMIIDLEGRATFWNPAAEEVFGWSEEEVIGRPLPLVPEDQRDEFLRNIAMIKEGELLRGVEVCRQRRDGALLDMLLFTSPLYNAEGQVDSFVAQLMDITEHKKAREQIVCLAHYDQLTGLANRILLRECFLRETSRAQRDERNLALCLIDLDKFKTINDALGHSFGDKLLVQVARRLEEVLRRADVICRPGGDEFLLLLTDLDNPRNLGKIARKILQNLEQPYEIGGHTVRLSASMGITIFPEDGVDLDTLHRNADTAMYAAKEKGRNNFMFFRNEMNQKIRDRLDLENILRTALEEQSFFLHYQPQVDIGSGRIIGAEALLRFRHPERGLIPPQQLISIAEESGLIVPLGNWIMEEACRQLGLWREQGLTDLTMAINLSPVQIFQEDFLSRTQSLLKTYRIQPGQVHFELTEGIFLQDDDRVRQTLLALKKQGVGLSLDDFGTGYSSLSYLKRYQVDAIKIDRSFVQDMCSNPSDAAIVSATIQMAHSLGLNTVAEGVETAEQLQFLQGQHCESYQGYFCSMPLGAAEFYALMQT